MLKDDSTLPLKGKVHKIGAVKLNRFICLPTDAWKLIMFCYRQVVREIGFPVTRGNDIKQLCEFIYGAHFLLEWLWCSDVCVAATL